MIEKKRKKEKKKKGIVTGPNQPLRPVWCYTRLLNSGGQIDQTCNLLGGAIPAQGLCSRIEFASIAIMRLASTRCVCVCVFVYVCVCDLHVRNTVLNLGN